METLDNLPVIHFPSNLEWHDWLAANYTDNLGLWLKISKKASGIPSVSYAEAVDEAICWGWIDGQKKAYDDNYFLQRFTPRRPRSIWSKVNVAKVETLTLSGRMQPSGLAAVQVAKQNGEWDAAYDSPSMDKIPADFEAALELAPLARQHYETLNKTNKYAIHWRIQAAKKPESRQKQIEKFIAMLEKGEKLH